MIFINLISAIDITMNTVITVFLIIQTLGIFFPRSFRVEFKNLQHFFFFQSSFRVRFKNHHVCIPKNHTDVHGVR